VVSYPITIVLDSRITLSGVTATGYVNSVTIWTEIGNGPANTWAEVATTSGDIWAEVPAG
jgi:hypothetical protein